MSKLDYLLESWARIEAKKVAKMLLADVILNLESLKYENDFDTIKMKITNETIDLCVTKIRQEYGLEPSAVKATDLTDRVKPKEQPSVSPSVPFIHPVIPPNLPIPCDPVYPAVKLCSKCGIQLSSVMGYCCPHPACPTGLGGVSF